MAIEHIDPELCTGCGICVNSCEYDVIRMDEETDMAKIVYQDDCILCCQCKKDCPEDAIHVDPGLYIPITTAWGK
jgi:NAD-dependent dihydropyrimidine dehydrogenase PreA subunit